MKASISALVLVVFLAGCQERPAPKGNVVGAKPADNPNDASDSQPLKGVEVPPVVTGKAPTFSALPSWTTETPSSNMRVAQFVLPKAEGDPEDATLVVFYFSGQGGTVEANFDRWISQFQQPDGADSQKAAKTSERTIQGIKVNLLDIGGTYNAETAPGSGEHVNKPGFASRNAVMLSNPGPYFIRLIGPQKTVERYSKDFDTFLEKSLQ